MMVIFIVFIWPLKKPANCRLVTSGCFCFLEFKDILLHLLHALLVKGVAVAKEEEHLKENKQRGCDESLIPRVKERRCPVFKDAVPNELCNPGGNMEGKNRLPERKSCHGSSSCH